MMNQRFDLFLRRSAAYLLDIVVLFLVLAPLGLLVQTVLKIRPQTGFEIWLATLVNFSLPVWLYFILSDHSPRGATLGKRLLRVRVASSTGEARSPSLAQAALRTLVKLLPWEIIHLSGFAIAGNLSTFSPLQAVGMGLGNLLTIVYLALALATSGRRSLHDFAAKTIVTARDQ